MILMIVIIFDDRDSVMAREVVKLQPPFGPKRYGGRKLVVRRNKDRADGVALAQSLHFLDIDALGVESHGYDARAGLRQRDRCRRITQPFHQIGSTSCRERVCQYVYISVVAVSLKKKNKIIK